MELTSFKTPKGVWYRHFDFWSDWAYKYFQAYLKIPSDAKHRAELNAFSSLTGVRLVFESNLIEGAGLSRGETRKIVEEYFPHIPDSYEVFRQSGEFIYLGKDAETDGIELQHIIPSITFGNKSKGMQEVVQHYIAYVEAIKRALRFHLEKKVLLFGTHQPERAERAVKLWQQLSPEEEFPQHIKSVKLLTEEQIKNLHKILAEQLLPEDAKIPAGEYRTDLRSVGDFEVVFPSPELIPDCMQTFVADANTLFVSYFTEQENMFKIAAKISYDFVRIHPFPDFNGRLSRLLLMMILRAYGIPFAMTLRGDKKGRHRYFTALKKANKYNILPYATLIAMRVAETFQEIDENIIRAGYPSILSFL